jgi:hypothetical protein
LNFRRLLLVAGHLASLVGYPLRIRFYSHFVTKSSLGKRPGNRCCRRLQRVVGK